VTDTPNNDSAKARFCGKKGRSGPRKGNRNNMRHGLRAGKLPVDCQHVEIQCNMLRRQLEDAVIAARGEVNLVDAANIQTALKWERHGALALRWLRVSGDKLKPVEQLTFSREIARASTERDKALAALKLDRDAKDSVLDALYARVPKVLTNHDGAADAGDR